MGRFKILKDAKDGKYKFVLFGNNGMVVLNSQKYSSKQSAKNGIASVVKSSQDKNKYTRKVTRSGQFYFTLKAANGEVVGTSEKYFSRGALELGIMSVINNASTELVEE